MTSHGQILGSALDLLKTGRFEPAADLCRAALAADGRDANARFILARALEALGRHVEAEGEFRATLRHAPKDNAAACAFGKFLLDRFRPKEAAAQADAALAFDPGCSPAHNLRGMALVAQGRMDDAVAAFGRAMAIDPSNAGFRANLGTALATEGRFDAALDSLAGAVQMAPDDLAIRLNHAIALLKAGRWPEGWAAWEWRHRQPGREKLPPRLRLPRLDDLGSLAGRTIFIHHEEGFGDTIQFLRYVRLLRQADVKIVLWLPEPLVRLARGQTGLGDVLTGDVTLPPFEWHCPINSLPNVFNTMVGTAPAEIPYLRADPALTGDWAAKLPRGGDCRVGLVWAGEPRPHDPVAQALDRRRSLSLIRLEPLLAVTGATFVSLQTGAAARQIFAPVHDPMGEVKDFADTAAIIANLDIVISVDTAVAHLAGALGKPAFLLDRYDNCWRWLSGRTDSPWYPAMRIFRQPRMGDWDPAIQAAAEALAGFVASRAGGLT